MDILLIWALVFVAALTWWPRCGDRHELFGRMTIMSVLLGLLLAWQMPSKWLTVYVSLFVIGVYRTPDPVGRLPLTVHGGLLWATVVAIVAPDVTVAWVRPLLWGIVACSAVAACWGTLSLWIGGRYDKSVQWNGITLLRLYEKHPDGIAGGQGNPNMLPPILSCGLAAALGLGGWAWLAAGGLCASLLAVIWHDLRRFHTFQPNQGMLYLGTILASCGIVEFGAAGWITGGLIGLGVTIVAWKHVSWWSSRQELWRFALFLWSQFSWKGKWFGGGPESWRFLYAKWQPLPGVATHAHNEFLHLLVEQGIVGMLAVMGYCVATLVQLLHSGPDGHAVFLVGAVLTSCACVSFPWTQFHAIPLAGKDGEILGRGLGSPALNVYSLATVLMAKGVLG